MVQANPAAHAWKSTALAPILWVNWPVSKDRLRICSWFMVGMFHALIAGELIAPLASDTGRSPFFI
jgi:hypothetical protein